VIRIAFLVAALLAAPVAADEKPAPALTPIEARQAVGKEITVEMTVAAAKDRLEKRGEVYLDCERDFKDPKNFAVVITRSGAASLREQGITDLAGHYDRKSIRATGTVKVVDGVPRIEVDEAKQLRIIEPK
jgi:hypothetical protein